MRIYRGNIGVELTLEEFSDLIQDEDQIDDLLNLIYEMEMDEVMNYNTNEIKAFEQDLYKEVAEYQRKQDASNDTIKMERTLARLEKYGR